MYNLMFFSQNLIEMTNLTNIMVVKGLNMIIYELGDGSET